MNSVVLQEITHTQTNFADFHSFVDVSFESSDMGVSFGLSTEKRQLVKDHGSIQGARERIKIYKELKRE